MLTTVDKIKENTSSVIRMAPRILGLCAPRKSGKTMTAKLFNEILPQYEIKSFATPIKELFAEEKGFDVSVLYDSVEKEVYRDELVQWAESKKQIDRRIFVNYLFNNLPEDYYIVIDDVRFIEEVEAILKLGGTVYRVFAENHHRARYGWKYDRKIDEHYSETELDLSYETYRSLGGGYLYNTKSQDYLREQVMELVKMRFMPEVN